MSWKYNVRDWTKPHLIEGVLDGERTWFLATPLPEGPIEVKIVGTLVQGQLYAAEMGIELAFIQPMYATSRDEQTAEITAAQWMCPRLRVLPHA